MPHMPRRLPPMIGIPPEFLPRPQEKHKPVQREEKKAEQVLSAETLGLPTLSIHKYKPDMKMVLHILTGKEPTVDPYTGKLVPASASHHAPAFGPHGAAADHAK